MAEWYLLNHPAPARGKLTAAVRRGERLLSSIGCTSCHVPDWQLYAADPAAKDYTRRYAGDRRFFELQVGWNDRTDRLEGKLVYLSDLVRRPGRPSLRIPRRGAYTVRGLYSDLKYHDVGENFYQVQFDGTVVRTFRTTPLWGVGSVAAHAHDGASLSLDAVIRRHGGEAFDSRRRYAALDEADRQSVIALLESLVLYQTNSIPCDIDGDGRISDHFVVARMDTGMERFNPEWLFRAPGRIEGPCLGPRATASCRLPSPTSATPTAWICNT